MTRISPWVMTAEARAPFRLVQPARAEEDPAPLPCLWDDGDQAQGARAITLEACLTTRAMREQGLPAFRLSTGPASHICWTITRLIAHHAAGGCNLMPGGWLGTGTISGPQAGA